MFPSPSFSSSSPPSPPSKPSIRVIARVRPALSSSSSASSSSASSSSSSASSSSSSVPSSLLCTTFDPSFPSHLTVTQTEKNNLRRGLKKGEAPSVTTYESRQTFTFDRVYYTDTDTVSIYHYEVERLITRVLNGGATCILAYGQTGSGKTHTISGNPVSPGIIHTVAVDLMDGIEVLNKLIREESESASEGKDSFPSVFSSGGPPLTLPNQAPLPTRFLTHNPRHQEIKVYVTAGEVYQETLLDLGVTLKDKPKRLTPLTLRRQNVSTAEELMAYLTTCIERRAQGATNKNDQSSRSHAVYLITLEYADQPFHSIGLLGLIDLAGAEYATATEGRETVRRMEGGKNNLGLMALKSLFRYMGQLDTLSTHRNSGNGNGSSFSSSSSSSSSSLDGLASLPIFSWHRSTLTKILKPFLSGSIDILIQRTKDYYNQQRITMKKDGENGNDDDTSSIGSSSDSEEDTKEENTTVTTSSTNNAASFSSTVPTFTSQDILLCVTVSPEIPDAYQTATALADGLSLLGRVPPPKEITDLGLQQQLRRQEEQQNYIYRHRQPGVNVPSRTVNSKSTNQGNSNSNRSQFKARTYDNNGNDGKITMYSDHRIHGGGGRDRNSPLNGPGKVTAPSFVSGSRPSTAGAGTLVHPLHSSPSSSSSSSSSSDRLSFGKNLISSSGGFNQSETPLSLIGSIVGSNHGSIHSLVRTNRNGHESSVSLVSTAVPNVGSTTNTSKQQYQYQEQYSQRPSTVPLSSPTVLTINSQQSSSSSLLPPKKRTDESPSIHRVSTSTSPAVTVTNNGNQGERKGNSGGTFLKAGSGRAGGKIGYVKGTSNSTTYSTRTGTLGGIF